MYVNHLFIDLTLFSYVYVHCGWVSQRRRCTDILASCWIKRKFYMSADKIPSQTPLASKTERSVITTVAIYTECNYVVHTVNGLLIHMSKYSVENR